MSVVLPFEIKASSSQLNRIEDFPAGLQEAGMRTLHLKRYLERLPVEEIGFPSYYEKLDKSLGDIRDPNVIYPVDDQSFVHILADARDNRSCYVPIEPSLTLDVNELVKKVEEACIEHGDKLPRFDVDADRKKQLLDYVDLVTTREKSSGKIKDAAKKESSKPSKQLVKVGASPEELEVVKYLFIRDKIGMGDLPGRGLSPASRVLPMFFRGGSK